MNKNKASYYHYYHNSWWFFLSVLVYTVSLAELAVLVTQVFHYFSGTCISQIIWWFWDVISHKSINQSVELVNRVRVVGCGRGNNLGSSILGRSLLHVLPASANVKFLCNEIACCCDLLESLKLLLPNLAINSSRVLRFHERCLKATFFCLPYRRVCGKSTV